MEGGQENLEMSISGGGGGVGQVGGSRWNPTKEQIEMLENLYKQGLRTPRAEEINQITNRLKKFGHIEGKNVFYWFQNHKARQRQKQKLDHHVSYVNRFLHKASSSNSSCSPFPNVLCSQFYTPYPEMGLCQPPPLQQQHQHQQTKILLPRTALKRRPVVPLMKNNMKPCGFRPFLDQAYLQTHNNNFNHFNHLPNLQYQYTRLSSAGDQEQHTMHNIISQTKVPSHDENKETLELFPTHPSGNLLQPAGAASSANEIPDINTADFSNSSNLTNKCFVDHHQYYHQNQGVSEDRTNFFEFLCGNGSSDQ